MFYFHEKWDPPQMLEKKKLIKFLFAIFHKWFDPMQEIEMKKIVSSVGYSKFNFL